MFLHRLYFTFLFWRAWLAPDAIARAARYAAPDAAAGPYVARDVVVAQYAAVQPLAALFASAQH